MDEKGLLSLAAYVITSSYRTRALTVLHAKGIRMPKYLAKDCNVRSNHISKTLKELSEHGLVECINPEARKGRLYIITDLGGKVYETLPSIQGKTLGELNDL